MASEFGFLPFTARPYIYRQCGTGLSKKHFDHRTQGEFSAFTNVWKLSIVSLDISSFVPKIREHFGQFSPTVQSLTLQSPEGSYQELGFFTGHFQRLRDLWINLPPQERRADDPILIPPFVPPLQGQLTVTCDGGGFAKIMTDLFGGVRSPRVRTRSRGTPTLLYARADTLETLYLDASDICGSSHRDLDLSRNKSRQRLEITAESLIGVLKDHAPAAIPGSFMALFSTITSSVFPDFVVVYRGSDFYNDVYSTLVANARDVDSWNEARSNRARAELGELGDEATWYHRQFEVFREMRKARDFRLVLQACYVGDDSVRELQRAVAAEMAVPGGLPITVSMPYTLRAH